MNVCSSLFLILMSFTSELFEYSELSVGHREERRMGMKEIYLFYSFRYGWWVPALHHFRVYLWCFVLHIYQHQNTLRHSTCYSSCMRCCNVSRYSTVPYNPPCWVPFRALCNSCCSSLVSVNGPPQCHCERCHSSYMWDGCSSKVTSAGASLRKRTIKLLREFFQDIFLYSTL